MREADDDFLCAIADAIRLTHNSIRTICFNHISSIWNGACSSPRGWGLNKWDRMRCTFHTIQWLSVNGQWKCVGGFRRAQRIKVPGYLAMVGRIAPVFHAEKNASIRKQDNHGVRLTVDCFVSLFTAVRSELFVVVFISKRNEERVFIFHVYLIFLSYNK